MEKTLSILLIEDSFSDAEMIIRALKKINLAKNLVHIEDGAKAIDFIFAKGDSIADGGIKLPKVVILDLNMPKKNGMDVLEKIRSDERTKRIPVVVLTSSKEDSDLKKCYDLGVNSYIVKPVEFHDFSQTVTEIARYWVQLNLTTE